MKKEIRTVPIELRVEGGDTPKIVGHAAVFDKWSEDLGGFREKIAPSAFTKTIKEGDIRALFNHDPNFVLGRNTAGTLVLEEDKKGLKVTIDPPDTQWARDLTTSIERGDINQMSFSFRTIKDLWTTPNNGKENQRELLEVKLFDVSPVTFPAYPQTDVGVRSIDVDELNRVLLKADKEIPLSDDDKVIIRENITVLESLAAEDVPAGGVVSELGRILEMDKDTPLSDGDRVIIRETIQKLEKLSEEPVTIGHSAVNQKVKMDLELKELEFEEDI